MDLISAIHYGGFVDSVLHIPIKRIHL